MTNRCDAFADLLVDLSDGELPNDQRPAVEAHLAGCPACREELRRLDTSLVRLCDGITVTSEAATRSAGRRPLRKRVAFQAAAASAALACLLGVLAWVSRRPLAERAAHQAVPADVVLSQADVLMQIALIEQQARLETSLDLMPSDPWYAEQRAENERLVMKFKSAVAGAAAGDIQ